MKQLRAQAQTRKVTLRIGPLLRIDVLHDLQHELH